MRQVVLNLRRMDEGKAATNTVAKRHLPTAGGIAARDRHRLSSRAAAPAPARPRGIGMAKLEHMCEDLPLYPEGQRQRLFTARAIRHDKMFELIGVQAKTFNQWLTRGKVPHAAYCIHTGRKGYPPKAYLEEEARALVNALNTHYTESLTFRDTDTGLFRRIEAAFLAIRERTAKQIEPCLPQ